MAFIPNFIPPFFGQPPTLTSGIGTQHAIAAVAKRRLEGHSVPESWLPHYGPWPKRKRGRTRHGEYSSTEPMTVYEWEHDMAWQGAENSEFIEWIPQYNNGSYGGNGVGIEATLVRNSVWAKICDTVSPKTWFTKYNLPRLNCKMRGPLWTQKYFDRFDVRKVRGKYRPYNFAIYLSCPFFGEPYIVSMQGSFEWKQANQ